MKKILTILFALMITSWSFGQGVLTGKVSNSENNEPLIGASVLVDGTTIGTVTDFDGAFQLQNVPTGTQEILISYIGFSTITMPVDVTTSILDMGIVDLQSESVGLEEVNIIASIASERKTPSAVSTIKGAEIEDLIGNQEYVEVLRKTPSVYVTKQGGGFGDSRINIRGFDQRNMAVMINGIPVNDMENGWVYWSNWAGLSDVTSQMQVQRGLGASKLAVPSVGASVNIVTNAADFKKGGKASFSYGNDNYQKYGLMLSSGQLDNGFAITVQGSHTRGDGYVDGTKFEAWSYFMSMSKKINESHTITLTALGAPQWHHQRNRASRYDKITLRTFEEQGIKFNHLWGTLDGKEFTWRKNFYHKPKAFLNHYWTISEKTNLKTSAYASWGIGGGTGPRGRMNTDNGRIYDSFSGFSKGSHDENGQVRWDDIVAYNQGTEISDWGSDSKPLSTTRSGDGFIRRASMNEHKWYGFLSTLTHQFTDNWTMFAGIDARYYKGAHYRRVENLLGNDSYESKADDNNPDNTITAEGRADGNTIAYHNDGIVAWGGAFVTAEYSTDQMSWYATASGANVSNQRVDYFAYLENDPARVSEWASAFAYVLKTGAKYNFGNSSAYLNAGVVSRQPIFDDFFVGYTNDLETNIQNQDIKSIDLGYTYRSNFLDVRLDLYNTYWGNRTVSRGIDVELPDGTVVDGRAIFKNVSQNHMGVEIDFELRPIHFLSIYGMAGIGDWRYTNDFVADVYDDDQNKIDVATLYANGLQVGDAAQSVFNIGVKLKPMKGLSFFTDYYYADRLFARFSVTESQFLSEGGVVAQLPSYGLMDSGLSYKMKVSGYDLTFRFNMNNVLDTKYVSEMWTNKVDDPSTTEDEFLDNQGFYGFGRTWSLGFKIGF